MFRMMFSLCVLCVLRGEIFAGAISGTVDQPGEATKLTAINRADDKRFPGEMDAKTGKFTIKDLPLDETYDLLFEIGDQREMWKASISMFRTPTTRWNSR